MRELINHKEVTDSDRRLVQALYDSEETQIEDLNLGGNRSWWSDQYLRPSLLNFVKSQTSLATLDLMLAYLSPSDTVDLLSWLCQSSNLATLKEMIMYLTFDFSLDEACELIAQLIDTATCLTECDIKQHTTNQRKVKVTIEYAV